MAVPDGHEDQFKREREKELTGRETEPWAIIYSNWIRSRFRSRITTAYQLLRRSLQRLDETARSGGSSCAI
jgi:hypothetical protein